MYKLMIVDDEENIRRGMARGIPWNDMGFEVVAQAEDGEDAVRQMETVRPDVVLSDIRMPKMDGVELMQYIYQHYPEIKIIILSGYNDVEYLNMAIRNRVTEYLLKPTDIDEFCALFQRLKQTLDEEHKEKVDLELLKATAEQGKELSYSRVLNNMLDGYVGDSQEYVWKTEMEERGMDFGSCILLVMDTEIGETESKENHYQVRRRVIQYCNARKSQWENKFFLHLDRKIVGIITVPDSSQIEAVRDYIQGIQAEIGDIYGIALLAGISPLCTREEMLPKMYQETEKTVSSMAPDLSVNEKRSNILVDSILDYINQNYCSNGLSLDAVADHFRKNPAYLSKVFKKETGFNFSDYITKKRMEKGKELLADLSLKIYEIAEMTGYADVSNFIKVFKKNCGMSPNEYRSII